MIRSTAWNLSAYQQIAQENIKFWCYIFLFVMSYADNILTNNLLYKHAFVIKKNPQWRMRRSPAYIETPKIRLPPAVNISHQNIRRVHSEHTQNFIYPSLKCKWPIHTKLLAPNDLILLSYRTDLFSTSIQSHSLYCSFYFDYDWLYWSLVTCSLSSDKLFWPSLHLTNIIHC